MLYFPKKSLTDKAKFFAKYLLIGECQTCCGNTNYVFFRGELFCEKEKWHFLSNPRYLPSFALKYQRISGFGQPSKIPGSLKHPKVR